MKKKQIRNVIVHIVPNPYPSSIKNKINGFHTTIIENALSNTYSYLTEKDKLEIINKIIEQIKV